MFLLVAATAVAALAAPAPESLLDFARRTACRQAYGLYMVGHKVGWSVAETRVGTYQGRPAAICQEEDWMRTRMMGDISLSTGSSISYYGVTGQGELLAAHQVSVDDGSKTTVQVERVAGGLRISRVSEGSKTSRLVPSPHDTLAEGARLERWLASARPGDTFSDWSCDWDAPEGETETLLTLVERRGPLTLLKTLEQGAQGELLARSDGTPERLNLGGGVELRAEEEQVAKTMPPLTEMLELLMVPVNRELGEARQVRHLELELDGLGDFSIPVSQRQRLRREGDRVVLELGEDLPDDLGRPLAPQERKRFLAATPTMTLDPEMRAQAAAIATATGVDARMGQLQSWVYSRLEKTGAKNATNASDVLHNRAGDCTEHTLLLVALARAAGIPAREVGGLAYAGEAGFAWHAWAEYHDGNHWRTVDPTWDEIPVDATHIKLNEDPRELSWLNLVGRLKMKVLEVGY